MTNEEEKGERRVLDLDKIRGEGKTLNEIIDIIESGEEIPDEVKETMQAFAKAVEPVVERSRAQMAELARTIGAWGHAESAKLGAGLARVVDSYQKTLDSYYEGLAESVAEISAGRFTGADVDTLVGWQYKALEPQSEMIAILEKMFEEERRARVEAERARKEERTRFWLALGVTIVIALVGWAIALRITQWL